MPDTEQNRVEKAGGATDGRCMLKGRYGNIWMEVFFPT